MGKKNCIVAQSGGPTVAINASLAGVVKGVKDSQIFDTIYGSVNGILGILNNNMINLSEIVANEETLNRLKHTPSMYLGSAVTNFLPWKNHLKLMHRFLKCLKV